MFYTPHERVRLDPSMLEPSDICTAFTCLWEGYAHKAYRDVGGVWTCGYGHTAHVGPATVCDHDLAMTWRHEDLNTAATAVKLSISVDLNQPEFDALCSFTDNVGAAALHGSTLRRRLNAGKRTEAFHTLMWWCHVHGRVVDGLVRRRRAELKLALNAELPQALA